MWNMIKRVVMTAAAKQFVTPLAFVSLTNEKVYDDLFSATDEQEMGHIQLSRDADLIVVMEHGDVVEQGTHEALLDAGGAYAALYQAQFEGAMTAE